MDLFDEMYDAAVAVEAEAGPDDIEAAEQHQHTTKLAVAAYFILVESVPRLVDDDVRAEIAWEIARHLRPGEPVVHGVRRWLPDSWKKELKRDANDRLVVNPMNAYLLLRNHPDVRGTIRFNEFSKQIEISGGPLARKNDDIEEYVTSAQDWIYATEGVVMNRTDLGYRIQTVAFENAYDPIRDYLLGLKWDGVSRVMADGGWLVKYAGARADGASNFVAKVGRKYLIGAVARGLVPGAKVDNVLLLEGDQGLKKSSLFEALGGPFYIDTSVVLGDKDSKMTAGSAWIAELPDMASNKRSEKNMMKAFFTTRVDKYRPPFGRAVKAFPRRCVWGTTSNDYEVFDDETGNRRYLSVTCRGVDGKIDVAGLLRDRDQLWAEAVAIYLAAEQCPNCAKSKDTVWAQAPRCDEHSWWPDRSMALAVEEQNNMRDDTDVWSPVVFEWLDNPMKNDVGIEQAAERVEVTTTNVLQYAIGKDIESCNHNDKIRVGKILRKAGWVPGKPHRGQRPYVRKEDFDSLPSPPSPKLRVVKK